MHFQPTAKLYTFHSVSQWSVIHCWALADRNATYHTTQQQILIGQGRGGRERVWELIKDLGQSTAANSNHWTVTVSCWSARCTHAHVECTGVITWNSHQAAVWRVNGKVGVRQADEVKTVYSHGDWFGQVGFKFHFHYHSLDCVGSIAMTLFWLHGH